MIKLYGISWDDPRGYDSIVYISERYSEKYKDIHIQWDKRSLYDFTVYPPDKLAKYYDLVVVDYPSVGDIAESNNYIPIDEILSKKDLEFIQRISVGKTYESYLYNGHLWALPIDAATQVSAYREDIFKEFNLKIPKTWKQVIKLKCKVGMPLSPIHAHSSFITMCVNYFLDPFFIRLDQYNLKKIYTILDIMKNISDKCGDLCLKSDPIKLLDYMAEENEICYIPLTYGYYNYSRDKYRKNVINYINIPSFTEIPYGSTLGGAGLAVSIKNKYIEETIEFIKWFYDFNTQKMYWKHYGQPADIRIWIDEEANKITRNSYINTIYTISLSYVRPNFPGFIKFHEESGKVLVNFLTGKISKDETIKDLLNLNTSCCARK
ncbi:carbohydrate ABC transporter substrate-binding protein [Sulfolobus sp. S-194]|uniref:ABC transporter substrate-binding protein n=1 Tax=Sulfolobus sp. S-194 TaxID=2512240 RepID=UPI0014371B18|nr:ABC transporter substrate-binding protein [Sulfolobus sp. S-194]QIW23819.1 carbohydrate ABC transporter substrate-binding protein [Sulfolobus sp. S-194]